jgi:hypothetical protein
MTNQNTEIRHIRNAIEYKPMEYGERAGEPTVSIKLSSSESNSIKVNSLDKQFRSYNWHRKINSGFARLRIHGDNPFADRHVESLNYLFELLDPRFVDFEIKASELTQEPARVISRKADTITVVFDENDDDLVNNTEALQNLAERGRKYGDTQFIFKTSSTTCEDTIKDFAREYKVYDSDIWIFPKGRKVKTTADNWDGLCSVAKRNTWNLSPRMDLISDYEEDE